MAGTTHTAGPWTVDGTPDNQIVWDGAGNRVCFLAHSGGLDDERDIATGHLIAAAPDMYQVLEALVTRDAKRLVMSDIIKAAHAALDKAEGSSHA